MSKFELKECIEEYYKNGESYEYCEEMYDMYKSEKVIDIKLKKMEV